MTKEELRKQRLKNEYEELKDFCSKCKAIQSMQVIQRENGVPTGYRFKTNIRTYISEKETTNHSVVDMKLDKGYPYTMPYITMHPPVIYHPNWFVVGKWCAGKYWKSTQSLVDMVKRMILSIQFDPDSTCPEDSANRYDDAAPWYIEHRNTPGMFPTDNYSFERKGFRVITKR